MAKILVLAAIFIITINILSSINCNNKINFLPRKIINRKSSSLIHYWSFDSHLNDEISGSRLYEGFSASLTNDRFNRPLSALSLNTGYYRFSTRNYFPTGKFTIMAWVNLGANNYHSVFFDFFEGPAMNTIFSCLSCNNRLATEMYLDNNCIGSIMPKTILTLKKWTHISYTFEHPIMKYYVNGDLDVQGISNSKPKNMTRLNNYLGKSNAQGNMNANVIIDDLKIFNEALNDKQIKIEMN